MDRIKYIIAKAKSTKAGFIQLYLAVCSYNFSTSSLENHLRGSFIATVAG